MFLRKLAKHSFIATNVESYSKRYGAHILLLLRTYIVYQSSDGWGHQSCKSPSLFLASVPF